MFKWHFCHNSKGCQSNRMKVQVLYYSSNSVTFWTTFFKKGTVLCLQWRGRISIESWLRCVCSTLAKKIWSNSGETGKISPTQLACIIEFLARIKIRAGIILGPKSKGLSKCCLFRIHFQHLQLSISSIKDTESCQDTPCKIISSQPWKKYLSLSLKLFTRRLKTLWRISLAASTDMERVLPFTRYRES